MFISTLWFLLGFVNITVIISLYCPFYTLITTKLIQKILLNCLKDLDSFYPHNVLTNIIQKEFGVWINKSDMMNNQKRQISRISIPDMPLITNGIRIKHTDKQLSDNIFDNLYFSSVENKIDI